MRLEYFSDHLPIVAKYFRLRYDCHMPYSNSQEILIGSRWSC